MIQELTVPARLGIACLLFVCLASRHADAQVIAWDDFEGYTAGATLNGQNQGYNWSSAWTASPAADVTAESGVIPTFGQSLQIDTATSNNANVFVRGFTPQTGTVYVGMLFRTVALDPGDFFQLYTNNTTGGSDTVGVSGGLRNQGSGSDNFYFARVDGTSNNQNTMFTHPDNTTQLVVFKYTNSADQLTNYDRTDLFINQFSEGTPDATVSNVNAGTTTLSNFHARAFSFDGTELVFIDNLAFANTFDQLFPQLTTTPNDSGTLDFGSQRVGTSTAQNIIAENTGSFTLTSLNFGTASGDFTRGGAAAGANLTTGQTDPRSVTFAPTQRGAQSSSVLVTADRGTAVGSALSSTINLDGVGTGPVFTFEVSDSIGVLGPTSPLPLGNNPGGVTDTGATINLGTADFVLGPDIITADIQITNMGDAGANNALTITDFLIDGIDAAMFNLLKNDGGNLVAFDPMTTPEVLELGDTLDLVVEFTADGDAGIGIKTANLTLFTDQGAALQGNGADFLFTLQAAQVPEPTSIAIWSLLGLAIAVSGSLLRTGSRRRIGGTG